jgi:hypothetical protein
MINRRYATKNKLYAWYTKNWIKRYSTESDSDRMDLRDARSASSRSLSLPVLYRRAHLSAPDLGVLLV